MNELTRQIASLVARLPQLPSHVRHVLVKIAPWLTIVGIVLAVPGILAVFGMTAFWGSTAGFAPEWGTRVFVGIAFAAVIVVLYIMALPGLFHRKASAWRLLYYTVLLGAVQSILSFDVVGLVIGTGISLYILFQIKDLYTN